MSLCDRGVPGDPVDALYVDLSTPSVARMTNVLLGGGHNFALDRVAAQKLLAAVPKMKRTVEVHREFTTRAVDFLAAAGIDQFLDLGAGIPAPGSTHDRAQAVDPRAAVVYVDRDPVVVAHIELMISGNSRAGVVRADLASPGSVLSDPVVQELIDLTRPVGVVLAASLHHHLGDAAATVAAYCSAVAAGSYVVISHLTGDLDPDAADAVQQAYAGADYPIMPRTRCEIDALFGALELVGPGLTTPAAWQPTHDEDPTAHAAVFLAGVGRKPHSAAAGDARSGEPESAAVAEPGV